MATERTLSIIKPDGVEKNLIGEIYKRFEGAGLRIVAARMMHLTKAQGLSSWSSLSPESKSSFINRSLCLFMYVLMSFIEV